MDIINSYINAQYEEYLYDDPIYTESIRTIEVKRLLNLLYRLINEKNVSLTRREARSLGIEWFALGKMYEQIYTGQSVDPVLPAIEYAINESIVEVLATLDIPTDVLNELQKELQRSLWRIANEYSGYNITISKEPYRYKVSYGPFDEYVSIDTYDWLTSLYTGDDFNTDLYRLLARYSSTGLYDTVWLPTVREGRRRVLDDRLIRFLQDKGVNLDLMASPLTTIVNNYTGLYPDVDYKFGSLGRFTDIEGLMGEGLFMWLNGPSPYADIALQIVVNLMQTTTIPLTLVAVIPDYVYSNTDQSIVDIPEDILTFTTSISTNKTLIILQNDEGVERWYFDERDISTISRYI